MPVGNTRFERIGYAGGMLAAAALYWALGYAGMRIGATPSDYASALAPATGFGVAALLLFGARYWVAVFLGTLALDVYAGAPASMALGIAVGNSLQALLAATLLRRFAGRDLRLERLRDVVGLILLGAVLSTMASATAGVASLWAHGAAQAGLGALWLQWWIGDMVGVLVVTPFVLAYGRAGGYPRGARYYLEAALITLAVAAASALIFGPDVLDHHGRYPLAFLLLPLIVWAAVRLEARGATAVNLLVAGAAAVATAHGYGPFALFEPSAGVAGMALFVAVAAATGLVLAASSAERRAVGALREGVGLLRQVLRVLPVGVSIADRGGRITSTNPAARQLGVDDASAAAVDGWDGPQRGALAAGDWPLARALADGGTTGTRKLEVRAADGVRRLLLSSATPLRDATGQLIGAVAVHQDMTALALAEAQGRRLVRTRGMIQDCLEAMARADDECALLEQICRVVVERGGYPAAWIGLAEAAAGNGLRKVAAAGAAPGPDDADAAAGNALRGRRPVLAHDVPGADAAELAVPLLAGQACLGVLRVRQTSSESFDDAEIELLAELARDLGFGLESLRARRQRARAEQAVAASRQRLQDIIDSMFGFVGLCTPEGVLLETNRAPLAGAGLKVADVVGKPLWETPWWSYAPQAQAQLRAALQRAAQGETVRYEAAVRLGEARPISVDVQFSPLRDADGRIVQILVFGVDVSESKRSEAALLAAEANLRGLLNSISEAVFLLDAEGYVLFANEAIARRLHTTVSGMMGRRIYDLVPDELAAYRRQMVEQVIASGKAVYHLLDRRGDRVLDNYLYPVHDVDGKVARVAVFSADITERTSAERALRQSEQLLRELAGNIPEIFWVREIAPGDAFLYLSPAWSALTGWPRPADLQGLFDVVHPEDYRRVVLEAAAAPHGGVDHEYRVVRADGGVRWLHVRTFPIRNAAGQAYRVAGVGEDISARKATEERLRRMAHYDALTDLPNRTLIRDTLARTLEQARHEGWLVAVLFIDIDRFKVVNDTLGHAMGDSLLQQVAARLRECVRIRDVVGRLGGDEFVLVLPGQSQPDDCGAVARKVLHGLAQPFGIDGREVFVTASIGITVFPNDTDDVEALLRFADTAMYRAKEDGRNTYRFYTAEMNARAEEKLELENSLRRALERRELLLHYQPKFDLASGALSGLEALLRWERPGHGLVAPGEFIPLLEETGLIVPVGQWVVDEVCRQLAAWRDAGLAPAPIAVNISSRQFQVGDVAAVITRAAREHGVPTHLIACEITESALMSYAARTIGILAELKAAGARISIDDFGTGYSSLSYLKRFPIDELKIDRVFVRDVARDANDAAIVLATLDLAHRLGLKVVAEGVEEVEQAEFLRANGCDEVQGFLFARPLPAVEVERVLRERRARLPQDFFGVPPA